MAAVGNCGYLGSGCSAQGPQASQAALTTLPHLDSLPGPKWGGQALPHSREKTQHCWCRTWRGESKRLTNHTQHVWLCWVLCQALRSQCEDTDKVPFLWKVLMGETGMLYK